MGLGFGALVVRDRGGAVIVIKWGRLVCYLDGEVCGRREETMETVEGISGQTQVVKWGNSVDTARTKITKSKV